MHVDFITPPENQGQIVEKSYVLLWDNTVLRCIYDQSDGSLEYATSRALSGDEGEYQNGAPKNKRWRKISHDEATRLLDEE
jgi:hypothetical protein